MRERRKYTRRFGVRPRGGEIRPLAYSQFREIHSAHIRSEKWKAIRERLFKKRGRKCEQCGSPDQIEVHHKHYNNLGRERLRDLEILCRPCHAKFHNKIP